MLFRGNNFGEKISKIDMARCPFDVKHALFNSIPDPVKSCINTFRSLDFDGIVGEVHGAFVVADDGSCCLIPAEELQSTARVM